MHILLHEYNLKMEYISRAQQCGRGDHSDCVRAALRQRSAEVPEIYQRRLREEFIAMGGDTSQAVTEAAVARLAGREALFSPEQASQLVEIARL